MASTKEARWALCMGLATPGEAPGSGAMAVLGGFFSRYPQGQTLRTAAVVRGGKARTALLALSSLAV